MSDDICNVKIILYDILSRVQIDEFSIMIRGSTIEETIGLIMKYRTQDYRILLVCRQTDVNILTNPIPPGYIDMIYILDPNAPNTTHNNIRVTASRESGLLIPLILHVKDYIHAAADDAQRLENNGIANACFFLADSLLDCLISNIENLGLF